MVFDPFLIFSKKTILVKVQQKINSVIFMALASRIFIPFGIYYFSSFGLQEVVILMILSELKGLVAYSPVKSK